MIHCGGGVVGRGRERKVNDHPVDGHAQTRAGSVSTPGNRESIERAHREGHEMALRASYYARQAAMPGVR